MKYTCSSCGYVGKRPVVGVDVIEEHGYLWCVKCAPIIFVNGEPRLCEFPTKGKMIPDTILHGEIRDAGRRTRMADLNDELIANARAEGYRAGLAAAVKALEASRPLAWALVEIATDTIHTVLPNDFNRVSDWIGEDEKPESYYVLPLYPAAVVKALIEEKP